MSQDTLEVVAGKINALQDKIGKADADRRKYLDSRNALILEAHERVSADPALTWEEWRVENIPDIGRRQVFRLLTGVTSGRIQPGISDPGHQSQVADPDKLYPRVADPDKLYPRVVPVSDVDPFMGVSTDVLPKPADPLDGIKRAIQQLTGGQFDELRDWMDEEAERLGR